MFKAPKIFFLVCLGAFAGLGGVACGEVAKAVPEEGAKADYAKGSHGGRLLGEPGFQVEVTIYERGVPPVFRVYPLADGKPIAPGDVQLKIDLHRHGNRVDNIGFAPEGDYLLGDKIVEEPHSFEVDVSATYKGTTQTWKYESYEGRVELTDEAVRTSQIKLETVGPAKMRSVTEMPGEVRLNPDKLAYVVPRLSGVIRSVAKNEGDEVKEGEVIAMLDSRELAEMRREVRDASQLTAFAKTELDRTTKLWKDGIASEASHLEKERLYREAVLKAQSARQVLAALNTDNASSTLFELRAPFDGVVIEKKVATGQAVKDDDTLFIIADLSTVWVEINVYAHDINAVQVGQKVIIEAKSIGLSAEGTISYMGALVGQTTRSAMARVVLPDPERKWRAGTFVDVTVVREEYTAPIAVKRAGLQKFRDWDVVFVRAGDTFEARPLELGRIDGEWTEVVSGLTAGERYASDNSFILKADVGKSGASHDH